ncbi:MAG: tetratricopeptide repeat protein [Spirulinaceae cyanobacterium]
MSKSKSEKKLITRILIILSGFAFVGTTFFTLGSLFTNDSEAPESTASQEVDVDETLAQQAEGFEKVLAREPENEFALKGLVETKMAMKDAPGAITPLKRALEVNPENQFALQGLIEVYLQTNEPQKAVEPLEKLIELNPEEERLKQLLAQLKEVQGPGEGGEKEESDR